MTLSALRFATPLWLLVGALSSTSLMILLFRLERQRRQALAFFSSRAAPVASLSRGLRHLKGALLVAGTALVCGALARPQYGFREEETYRRGLDLMFVIDTSKSMLTPDVKPDRLTRAKLALYDLVAKFPGDRVGLVAFAGEAFLQAPLTLDRNMFMQSLNAVDTSIIPRGGTDLGRALRVAVEALRNQPANRKLLVVLTDGEDLEAGAMAAAREAGSAGVRIYAVGVGTPSGELIPLPGGGFVKDESGAFVRSRLDENTLKEIASITGGQYRALGSDGRGLEQLYDDVLAKLPQDTVGERMHRIPLERFEWPLGLGAGCLALEALLQERRRRRAAAGGGTGKARPFRLNGRVAAGALGLLALLGLSSRAHASVSQAEKDYRNGKFTQAASEYRSASGKHPEDGRLQLNYAAAAYKTGDYAAANAALQQALHSAPPSDGLELQQRAYYDLGNSLYRTGQKSVQADPAQTKERWKEAIDSYDGALKLDPRDGDAIYNRDFVKKKLAELDRQQKQPPKPDPKQPDPKPDDKQKKPDQQQQAKNGGSGKPDQKKDEGQGGQPGQGQAKSDQSPQNAGSKPGQSGQPDRPKPSPGDQSAQGAPPKVGQGQAPDGKPSAGQPGLANGVAGPDPAEGSPEPQPKPGQLSRADARALLDSLRGDERLMSAAGVQNVKRVGDAPIKKDW